LKPQSYITAHSITRGSSGWKGATKIEKQNDQGKVFETCLQEGEGNLDEIYKFLRNGQIPKHSRHQSNSLFQVRATRPSR
jgi:hypothetical protein